LEEEPEAVWLSWRFAASAKSGNRSTPATDIEQHIHWQELEHRSPRRSSRFRGCFKQGGFRTRYPVRRSTLASSRSSPGARRSALGPGWGP